MAIIKKRDLKTLGKEDMLKKLAELKLELSKDRASAFVGGSVKNPGKIKEMKKTVARIKTFIASKTKIK